MSQSGVDRHAFQRSLDILVSQAKDLCKALLINFRGYFLTIYTHGQRKREIGMRSACMNNYTLKSLQRGII